jgi:hypothetical protein
LGWLRGHRSEEIAGETGGAGRSRRGCCRGPRLEVTRGVRRLIRAHVIGPDRYTRAGKTRAREDQASSRHTHLDRGVVLAGRGGATTVRMTRVRASRRASNRRLDAVSGRVQKPLHPFRHVRMVRTGSVLVNVGIVGFGRGAHGMA